MKTIEIAIGQILTIEIQDVLVFQSCFIKLGVDAQTADLLTRALAAVSEEFKALRPQEQVIRISTLFECIEEQPDLALEHMCLFQEYIKGEK
jgi:hypothetical protein